MLNNIKIIKEIAKIARNDVKTFWKESDMKGACGVASWHLMRLLMAKGFSPAFKYVPGHCWIELDNYVIDITATQFNINPAFITRYRNFNKKKFDDITIVMSKTYNSYDNPTCLQTYLNTSECISTKKHNKAYAYLNQWSGLTRKDVIFLRAQQRLFEQKKVLNDL